jgi:hypothetical protein
MVRLYCDVAQQAPLRSGLDKSVDTFLDLLLDAGHGRSPLDFFMLM